MPSYAEREGTNEAFPAAAAAGAERKPRKEISAGLQAWTKLIAETHEKMKASGWTHPETGKPASRKDAMAAASAAKHASPLSVAAASVSAPDAAAPAEKEPEEWIRKNISGKKHLWNPANNHLYLVEADGSQGAWAGLYNPKTGKVDTSVPEPEHNGGSRKQKSTRRRSTKSRKTRRN